MKFLNKIIIHPFTIFLLLIGLLTGYFRFLVYIFLIVLIHELGHLLIACFFKRKIISLTILPFGGLLKLNSLISENIYEDLLIATGGIFFQTIFGFLLMYLNYYSLIDMHTYSFLRFYNSILIIFNLIPICPLDGYKIMKLISELIIPFKKTFSLCIITSGVILILIILLGPNLVKSNILVFCFLFIMSIDEIKKVKYLVTRFYLERINRNFNYPKKNIKKIDSMYKNKINYIGNIHEKSFLKNLFTSKNQ